MRTMAGAEVAGLTALERAGRVLSRPWLLWALASVFGARTALLTALSPDFPDGRQWWMAGRMLWSDPAGLYPLTAAIIARSGRILVPGTAGFLAPPLQVWMAAPFALLPEPVGVRLWVLADAAAIALAAWLLLRRLAPRHPAAVPLCWLLTAYFPPVFADLSAGQRGGAVLLAAMAAVALEPARPLLAGVAGGFSAALKLYPVGLALGAPPCRRGAFLGGLGGGLLAFLAASFILFGSPLTYLRGVVLPAASVRDPDCGITSVKSLWERLLGGEAWAVPGPAGIQFLHTPLDAPGLATALWVATGLAVAGGALWAAGRSGWAPPYGMALGFALGALLPGEVYPYQWLPLLPLVLVVAARAADLRRAGLVAVLLVCLLGFARPPCELPFPNLWTLAGLATFGVGLAAHGLFREPAQAG